MNVNIRLSPEDEDALRRRAESVGQDVETFVANVIVEELAAEQPAIKPSRSHEEFTAKLRRFIERYGVHVSEVDDSRESIYGGRGE